MTVMRPVPLDDASMRFAGIIEVERTSSGAVLHRLPAWARAQATDPALSLLPRMPSGGRIEMRTDTDAIELDVDLTIVQLGDAPPIPAAFDLVVDGRVAEGHTTTDGTLIIIDAVTGAVSMRPGQPITVRFEGLGAGDKQVEVWLPHAAAVTLQALRVDDGASIGPAPSNARRWVHYGSSISHCFEADRPTGVWPVVAARHAGVDLQSLAFAGQCHLDPFVARTIRDLPADLVSLKVGINVVNGDTMRERVFGPAVHGFLDTVREGHPDIPLVVVTPIICPVHEEHPGPTSSALYPIEAVPRPPALETGALTLQRIRQLLSDIVAARRDSGDANLHLIDGLALFGEGDLDDLPDGLHPNTQGYLRIGHRFAELAFGDGGPFATTP